MLFDACKNALHCATAFADCPVPTATSPTIDGFFSPDSNDQREQPEPVDPFSDVLHDGTPPTTHRPPVEWLLGTIT